jgi:hypothetical protein
MTTAVRATSLVFGVTLGVAASSATLLGQADGMRMAPFRIEIRLGSAIPPDRGPSGDASGLFGGLFAIPLGRTFLGGRSSVQFAADYTEFNRTLFVDPQLGQAAATELQFLLAPRFGITTFRTPRFVTDVHAGAAIRVERTTFALASTPDTDTTMGDEYENVCDLVIAADRCRNSYEGLFTLGAGFRLLRKVGGVLFFGAEYGWTSNNRHQIVGTVGTMLP